MKTLLRIILGWLFKVKLYNWERLVFTGPSVILPNHLSFLDAIFMYAYLPDGVCFVVNTAIAEKISFVLRWVDHVTVDPLNPYAVKKIVAEVKAGRPVVLFPEGRITKTGNLMKIYSGVGFVALKTGAKLYPITFSGLQYSKLSRIKDKVKTHWLPKVAIYAGSGVKLETDENKSFKLQKKEISDKILILLQETLFAGKQETRGNGNLFDRLIEAGKLHGMGKTMAVDLTGELSYRKAITGSYVLGGKFEEALAGQERVGVLLPNSVGHVVTLFALFYCGKSPAVLNFSAGAANNVECAGAAGVKTILTSRQFVEKAALSAYVETLAAKFALIYLEDIKTRVGLADKIAALLKYLTRAKAKGEAKVILYTSGSENKPKGVVLSHANILANINQAACVYDYTHRDMMLNALPMFHSFGLTAGTLLPILEGIEVFLYPSPLHYKVVPEVAYDRNVTLLLGTPTFLFGYARHAHQYDFYNLRYVLAGGERLKDEVKELWQEKFGIRIYEGYGTTETAPVLSINSPLLYKAGTVGRFLPGISWQVQPVEGIEDGGRLLVKGPNVMEGYIFVDKGFVPAQEWYDCGDLVSVDAAGYVTVKSRLKRFAKVSGEMISLDAVEQAAQEAFGSDKNAAVSIGDDKKGEKIILYTQDKNASKQKLREHISLTRQSMLTLPFQVVVLEKLPLLGSGKVDYVSLRQAAEQEADAL